MVPAHAMLVEKTRIVKEILLNVIDFGRNLIAILETYDHLQQFTWKIFAPNFFMRFSTLLIDAKEGTSGEWSIFTRSHPPKNKNHTLNCCRSTFATIQLTTKFYTPPPSLLQLANKHVGSM